jgi:UDP-N-acetylglucosamine:LPS N-acetylglucosamine transferase
VVADRPLSGDQQDLLAATMSLVRGEASLSSPREFPAGRSYAAWLDAADLVLSLGATPLYAAAVLGIPAVVVAAEPFAAAAGRRFAALGFGHIPVGPMLPSAESLAAALLSLLGDNRQREAMTKRGRALVDGRGAARVVALIDTMSRSHFSLVSRPHVPEVASCLS